MGLRNFAFALVSSSWLAAQEIATQVFPIETAHMTLTLPSDWIKMPEKALNNIRQEVQKISPNIKSNYVVGFAGPKPPPNTPLTLLLVQVLPMDLTPDVFLTSAQASQKALAMMRPDLSLKQTAPYVNDAIGAVVAPGQTQKGSSGRSYTMPTSKGVITLDLYCPTEGAEKTFELVESCLKKLSFTGGVERNAKWLDEFKAATKAK